MTIAWRCSTRRSGRIVAGVVVEGRGGGGPADDHSGDEARRSTGPWPSSRHPAGWAAEIAVSLASYLTWRYGHIFMFGRLAAMSAGLHIAAFFLEHETNIGTVATAVSVVIPVASTSTSWFELVGQPAPRRRAPADRGLSGSSSGTRQRALVPPQPGRPHDAVVAL